jgi:imidazolonepropionase-like amidohydrolase
MSEERLSDELIGRMIATRMVIVPTLGIRRGRDLATAVDNLRHFLARGGKVLYGTDLGNYGPRPGIDPREVAGMTDAGMTLRDVIASATLTAAHFLNLRATGVLKAGSTADVIAVDGDATSDASALTRCKIVFRAGRRLR